MTNYEQQETFKFRTYSRETEKTSNSLGFIWKEVIHKFSAHDVSGEEHDTLSYSFDHHIPRNFTRNEVNK